MGAYGELQPTPSRYPGLVYDPSTFSLSPSTGCFNHGVGLPVGACRGKPVHSAFDAIWRPLGLAGLEGARRRTYGFLCLETAIASDRDYKLLVRRPRSLELTLDHIPLTILVLIKW
jgi:hypothetical protein